MTPQDSTIEAWSDALYGAHRDRVQIPGPSNTLGELSLHEAYEVQARVAAKRIAAGERQTRRRRAPERCSAGGERGGCGRDNGVPHAWVTQPR